MTVTCCEIHQIESVKDLLHEGVVYAHYNKVFNSNGVQTFEPALIEVEINNETNILEVIIFNFF
jgi:hypothetical protein